MKVAQLLHSPVKWTTGEFARDKRGKATSVHSKDARCFCLAGALLRCSASKEEANEAMARVERYIAFDGIHQTVIEWNDSTTFEEVRRVVKALDL